MSSFAGYCRWCEKPVMHKTLFGTLHLCLTPEEKQEKIAYQAQLMQAQQQNISNKFLKSVKQFNKAAKVKAKNGNS